MNYKLVTERSHLFAPNINVCLVVEFCKEIETEAIRGAIIKVLKKHPSLRSSVRFDDEGNSFYETNDEVNVEFSSVEMTDENNWKSIVSKEQEKPFVLSAYPLIRFTYIKDKGNIKLLMCVHHVIADGLSCVKILQEILSFLKEPNQTIEVVQPNLLEDTILYHNEKLDIIARLFVNVLNKKWSKERRLFCETQYYPMRESYWRHRSHTIESAALNEDQTSRLISNCKNNGITVNTYLVTTLLEAAQKMDKRNTKIGLAVSIRPKEMSVGNFASGISINTKYNNRMSIWKNASRIQRLVNKKLKNNKTKYTFLTFLKAVNMNLIDSMHFSIHENIKRKSTELLRRILGYNEPPFGLGLSNLGNMNLSELDGVKSVYFIPPLIANIDKIVGVITTDSGIRVTYQYSNNENAETNRKIFDEFIKRLKNN